MPESSLIDRSVKKLFRRVPEAFLRLAGLDLAGRPFTFEDVTVIVPEHRADQVLLVGEPDDPERWALYLEYQTGPETDGPASWMFKYTGLNRELQRPVLLVVLYLTRGDRATFPNYYEVRRGGVRNRFEFHAVRLWDYASRIRSGELWQLAPLLVLCEKLPTLATLRRERELILQADVPDRVRGDLLALAMAVGSRHFARDLLVTFFREELMMLKDATDFDELFGDIIADRLARSEAHGREIGEALGARDTLLTALRYRFGELPAHVVERVEQAEPNRCRQAMLALLDGRSLDELGL